MEVALERVGLPVPHGSRLRAFVGPPLRDSFAELGADPAQIGLLVETYRERYRDTGMFENAVYPKIPALLEELRTAGHRLLVATSKPTTFAEAILEHFDLAGFFDDVFGSNLDGSLGQKSELIAHIRSRTGFSPSESAFVGDRRFDISAARTHGIWAIGALWGYGSRAELETAGADRLAATPDAVVEALPA